MPVWVQGLLGSFSVSHHSVYFVYFTESVILWVMCCFPPKPLHPTIWLCCSWETPPQRLRSLEWLSVSIQVWFQSPLVETVKMFFRASCCSIFNVRGEFSSWHNETVVRLLFSVVSLPTGDSVVVVGYGGLGRSCGPSMTCGVLSKTISLSDNPVMLQTTCAVQAGTSGGAVVRRSSGELLGKKGTAATKCTLFDQWGA